jgi:CRP-like cAMP-binding protein
MFEVFQKYLSDKIAITQEELDLVQSLSFLKKLRKRQYLLQEGDVWKYHAFVCKGCLRTYRTDEKGQEHIMQFSIENWWAGDLESLRSGLPAKSAIEALEDAEVLLFTKENFDIIQQRIPAFKTMVEDILARSFIVHQNRIHTAISYTAEEKYTNFTNSYPQIFNRVPLHMIASYLGVTAETLSRIRKQAAAK